MNFSPDYAADHLIAKIAIYILYLLVGVVSIETSNPYFALIFGTALWLFGINGVARCVENLRGHQHSHNLL